MEEYYYNDEVKEYVLNNFSKEARANCTLTIRSGDGRYLYYNQHHTATAHLFVENNDDIDIGNITTFTNEALESFGPLLEAYEESGSSARLDNTRLPISSKKYLVENQAIQKTALKSFPNAYAWVAEGLNYFVIDGNIIFLSTQESRALLFYLFGFSTKSIAQRIGVLPSTAKTYLQRIKVKFDVDSHEDLVLKMAKNTPYMMHCLNVISAH